MAKANKGQNQYRNKLSRTYKFKKKTGKVKKRTDNNDPTENLNKKAKIIIRNLSFKINESDLRRLYEPFGEIEEINILKRPDGKLVGCGFVQFKNVEDASKAIFKTNKSDFLGRTISTEWAIPKSQFERIKKEEPEANDNDDNTEAHNEQHVAKTSDDNVSIIPKKSLPQKKNALSKAEQRKLYKLRKKQKRSRIVIRNMPFSITEGKIKEQFSKYGNIEEIKILKKPNGTPTGCCFLQFDRVQSAAQAIHYENMKTLENRPIVVDWAVAKDKFEKSKTDAQVKVEVKEEDDENLDESEMKEEESDRDEIEKEHKSDKNHDSDVDSDDNEEKNYDVNDDDDDDDDDDEDNDIVDGDDKKNVKLELDNESVSSTRQPRRISNDVSEGKTIFIKNVPFSVNNEELKKCMEQFGPVYYALICMDRLTEHSKGTAFVKFRDVEAAEKCLAAGTELKLHDQILDPHKALHRNEVNEKNQDKKTKVKDSRNLFLVKEGVILASSPAAQDVSAADMARRLELEKWKSQMLRNLNMFVSRVRLVIQNLPPSLEDSKLRQLFKNHSNPGAIITEARVMRDLRNVDANGIGKSKEYGFVSFTSHEDALKALRSINNNPNIFTRAKRPIVAFSIENRIMVNAKQKRVEKSRQNTPRQEDRKRGGAASEEEPKGPGEQKRARRRKSAAGQSKGANADGGGGEVECFAGTTSKPGATRPSGKFFLKKQASQHAQNLKQQKKKAKSLKQLATVRKEQKLNRREAKPKQGSRKPDADEANFSRLVSDYKSKLAAQPIHKSKWYET